ncbi:RagB/SusD family nutrient uptake outer membrane protein [Sphingobacterium detergens]|uniref:SusD-like starch-binding protein associating with outer membrane n=1 Tax=Sphingobacterium detergens TaxID=1145106 RepID=A0A420B6J4_SPHD1|nr:RagB/SusD family nutrient uptake outer membrane protein [Sphingobacterium detergens]RKE52302.1 SusD-like starch-binding protein associating with outer membrane [Sphingobacterium detergens]
MEKKLLLKIVLLLSLILNGCGKEFLEKKRNANQVVPSKVADYQAILDNRTNINNNYSAQLMIIGTDEYILTDEAWNAIGSTYSYLKNGYIWADNVYEANDVNDWNKGYQLILYANMALDVEKVKPTNTEEIKEWNNVKGQALFHRAFAFYQLAQTFCAPYDLMTADKKQGIPLRTNYDVSVKPERGTLKQVYDMILQDLNKSVDLLPDLQPNNYRPSKIAAYALLARIYREIDQWNEALACAEKVLQVKNQLLDYNDFRNVNRYTFGGLKNGLDNKEIIFYCFSSSGYLRLIAKLPENWHDEVFGEDGDLRPSLFFKDNGLYFGSYAGGEYFTGLAIDEVLLIRAECYVRMNEIPKAVQDLNNLRKNRFTKESYRSISDQTKESLLASVLLERKRELYMRGNRWSDLRQLNLDDPKNRVTLERKINGTEYRLEPNGPKWIWPFPDVEQ